MHYMLWDAGLRRVDNSGEVANSEHSHVRDSKSTIGNLSDISDGANFPSLALAARSLTSIAICSSPFRLVFLTTGTIRPMGVQLKFNKLTVLRIFPYSTWFKTKMNNFEDYYILF